jgi:hypothetical protein
VCDLETSRIGAPYIYIYDISNLRVNDHYSTPNVVRLIKSRKMRWAGLVARMGERRGVYRVLVGKPERKIPLGRPRRRCGTMLRWIFRKWDIGVWTESNWFRIGTGGGHVCMW